MVYKEDFYAFLEDAGCLNQWGRNLNITEDIIFGGSPSHWLSRSFSFSEVSQSTEYWRTIDKKWGIKCLELEEQRRKIEQVGLGAPADEHLVAFGEYEKNTQVDKPLDIQIGGSHYKDLAIQPIEYITQNNLPYIEGNIIKYVTRYKLKNGLEDLNKAKHYLDMLIESYTKVEGEV